MSVTLTYAANRTGVVSGLPAAVTVTQYNPIAVSSALPTAAGVTFGGWAVSPTSTVRVRALTPSANTTLYAIWLTGTTYQVVYNKMSSSTFPALPTEYYLAGATVSLPTNTDASNTLTFLGWSNGNINYNTGGVFSFTMPASNVVLSPRGVTTSGYKVTYTSYGSTGAVPVDSNNYSYNSTITVLPPGALVRAGYTFVNWSYNNAYYQPGASIALNVANIMLNANWVVNGALTYNLNGGTGTVPTDSTSYAVGATGTVSSAVPTRPGFAFNGWNRTATGSGLNYNTQSAVMTGDLPLYAMWR